MARFRGEPLDLPDYLVQGLEILADQTEEQPWPTEHMVQLLRAMARGCVIRDGKMGYFEVCTKTFHIGMVTELMGDIVTDVQDAWVDRTGQQLEQYWMPLYGSSQRRKATFRYERAVPVTLTANVVFDVDEFTRMLREAIQTRFSLVEHGEGETDEGAGRVSKQASWAEEDLAIDVGLMKDSPEVYHRHLKFCKVKINICKRRVMKKLGFPVHMAD